MLNSFEPGLALRPGNPNVPFSTSSSSLKQAPSSLFPGKENSRLAFQSPNATSNPYLNSNDHGDGGDYNPLYGQPRENLDFRVFQFKDDEKPLTSAFPPVNNHEEFNGLPLTTHHTTPYDTEGNNGDDYGI